MITKIIFTLFNGQCYVYLDGSTNAQLGQITYWFPLLVEQIGGSPVPVPVTFNGQPAVEFTTNVAGNWNIAVVTTLDGDSISNYLPWEYLAEMTDGNGAPVARLWNDNQDLHEYDNGNSGVNVFALNQTGNTGVGKLHNYAVVIPKRQTTFAADWDVAFAGVQAGSAVLSAVIDPDNAVQWLVKIDLNALYISDAAYFTDNFGFGSVVLVKFTTHT